MIILANLKYFLAGQNPIFCRIFLVFCRTPPVISKHTSKVIGPTPQTYVYTLNFITFSVYQKIQDTHFAGHLAEFAGKQDN